MTGISSDRYSLTGFFFFFCNGKITNTQHMKSWWIIFPDMEFIGGKLIKIVLGVEKAGNRWFSWKNTELGIRNRVQGLVLLGPYYSKIEGSRGGRGWRGRRGWWGWLREKLTEKHREGNPDSGESKKPMWGKLQRGTHLSKSKES